VFTWLTRQPGSGPQRDVVTGTLSGRVDEEAPVARAPTIRALRWGTVDTDVGTFRDAKLWPGGGRGWDWNETGTAHDPGIQPADVVELLDHGARTVVLSRGQQGRLQVMDATLDHLREAGAAVEVLASARAVDRYNELAGAGEPVGLLLHSTC
jgi:hypothetical protein